MCKTATPELTGGEKERVEKEKGRKSEKTQVHHQLLHVPEKKTHKTTQIKQQKAKTKSVCVHVSE